jgi:uncharacterized protein YndB with AHSA1/START domain
MNAALRITPVRKTVSVKASLEDAFDVFANGMETWWPRGGSHTILKSPLKDVVVEPFAGGRWYHRGIDGVECDLGRVVVWQPPHRLVLGWQLNGRWEYEPDHTSEVEVTFTQTAPGTVEVALEHRALEAFGDTAQALRGAVDSEGGWSALLALYARAVAQ